MGRKNGKKHLIVSEGKPALQDPQPEPLLQVMDKVPPGFRETTQEENGQLADLNQRLMLIEEKRARIQAQYDLLHMQNAQVRAEAAAIKTMLDGLRAKLGTKGRGDMIEVKGKLYVREVAKLRKLSKREEARLQRGGNVEVIRHDAPARAKS
jgi:hypothetical protein